MSVGCENEEAVVQVCQSWMSMPQNFQISGSCEPSLVLYKNRVSVLDPIAKKSCVPCELVSICDEKIWTPPHPKIKIKNFYSIFKIIYKILQSFHKIKCFDKSTLHFWYPIYNTSPCYYASIRSLSLRHIFSVCFFNIGSANSRCGTSIEQHCSRRKWDEGGRKEHKVETR